MIIFGLYLSGCGRGLVNMRARIIVTLASGREKCEAQKRGGGFHADLWNESHVPSRFSLALSNQIQVGF